MVKAVKNSTYSFDDILTIGESVNLTYQELTYSNQNDSIINCIKDSNYKFALYHAFMWSMNFSKKPLTSKFLMNYLKTSFQTSQKVLNKLVSLCLLKKIQWNDDRRIYIYEISEPGLNFIILWESLKVNAYSDLMAVSPHNHNLKNINEHKMSYLKNIRIPMSFEELKSSE